MKNISKSSIFFNEKFGKESNISDIYELFYPLEFIAFKEINEIIPALSKSNNILILSIKEFNIVKPFLDNGLPVKFLVAIYEYPEEDTEYGILPEYVYDIVKTPVSLKKLTFLINKAFTTLKNQVELSNLHSRFEVQSKELHTLNSIGISLSTERDVDKLLETILYKCREITKSDSGSLYFVDEIPEITPDPKDYFSNKRLLFKLAQNYTVAVPFQERLMDLNKKSISGYVALTGKPLLIKNAYHLPEDCEYSHNKSFDESIGYKCTSMLIVPMKNQKDEIIGVIQLINKKLTSEVKLTSDEIVNEQVIEYDESDQELVYSLASQAAILIDNTKLYYSIRNLFEGFIKASVTAIEARDPTTSGHSERVAHFTVSLAEIVDSIDSGNFSNIRFSRSDIQQIKYASLLHDFGKIGVREDVLVKAKKLYPFELDLIIQRFRYIRKCMELNFANIKLEFLINNSKEAYFDYVQKLENDYNEKLKNIDDSLRIIISSNEPTILAQETSEHLQLLSRIEFEDLDNTKIPFLNPYELESLSITKGSLREDERKEIESHVTHTYGFLSKIPWTNEFKQVPNIAYSHHEKLDGTGYPRGINSENIPLPSKMMAISDIYDALTASDRPYKKALPAQKALDILGFEVKAKKLDEELYKIFIDAKIYDVCKKEEYLNR